MEVYLFPLSNAQKRLWYQEQIEPGNIAYNIPLGLHLFGKVDRLALERVFQTIVNRHEILRTTFDLENGEPVQLIHSEMTFELGSEKIAKEEIDTILAAVATKPFDLKVAPLIRATLYQIEPEEHILFVNMHHIIGDGWSLGIFVKEISQLYPAYAIGAEGKLEELPIQYGDFAEWEQNRLETEAIQKQVVYWQEKLAKLPPALNLPLDFQRPDRPTYQGNTIRETLSVELTRSLENLVREQKATFFMVTFAVYLVFLSRYSSQTDIIVGTPVANRQKREIANLIGFFVKMLPLRVDLSGNPSFRELLDRVVKTSLGAYANQDVSVEEINGSKYLNPIFQTIFAVQNAPLGEIQLPGLSVNPIRIDNQGAKYDLSLTIEPSDRGYLANLEYNSDLFAAATARRMLKHYIQLLSSAVENPDCSLTALPLLSKEERLEILQLGKASFSRDTPENLVDWFVKTARTYPDRVAVKAGETTLTYRELDRRSDLLAELLQQKGVSGEVRVGIFQDRSEKLIVSLLAVLKAGGIYVPLDPAYPAERINFILEDSNINLLLTESALLDAIEGRKIEIISVDRIDNDRPSVKINQKISPDRGAYIIYTSGSTGKPKGCTIPHSNVCRLMRRTEPWFNFSCEDVWTLFHSFAFDFSVWEIWGALLYGGKLVVVPYWESRSPSEFRQLLRQERVTILNQTPSAFRQLIRADAEAEGKLNLRAVIFGGEALELESLRPWLERYGDRSPRLINMYGITETTVHVTYRPIMLADLDRDRARAIGQPISDLSLHLLDERLEPTPLGVAGEIYVGGMGVARGYLNRPDLTAERFVPDPFSDRPGARLYRTGDLGRRLANGDLEYLGRCDRQVKVRGFRIELGEIEAALAAIPEVAEAIVEVCSEPDRDKRLVAYLVCQTDLDRSKIRAALKDRLPEYAIPAAFVCLDTFPLTPHGKVDRRALPAPDWTRAVVGRSKIPPQTEAEKIVCQVWQAVLGLDAVGREDNFFELGGDSILALKVVAQMTREGWEITPKDIFQQQTVARVAAIAKILSTPIVPDRRVSGEVVLSPIQRWFFDLDLSDSNHWNQAVLLEIDRSIPPEILEGAIYKLAEHHDIFRVRFEKQGDLWQQFYTDEPVLAMEKIDLAGFDEDDRNAAMKQAYIRLHSSLDLKNGPLARAAYFDLGSKHLPRLLLTFHHLIIDGVSWRIVLEDLEKLVSKSIAGESIELAPRVTSFQHWSDFLISFTRSETIQTEKQFWLNMLQKKAGKLPIDFPETADRNWESSNENISLKLTKEQTKAFLTSANRAYRTSARDLLLVAVAKTWLEITNNQSIMPIMMESHGREQLADDLDISRTAGWFTVLYPLHFQLSANADDDTLIKDIKEQIRAVPRNGLGYSLLRYLSDICDRELEVPFTPQISFNYLGQVITNKSSNQLFNFVVDEDLEALRDPQGSRPYIIEILAIVVEGQLKVDWSYSNNLHSRETISRWAELFKKNLEAVLTFCTQPGVGGYTPSDFPLVKLDRPSLDLYQKQFPNLQDIYPLSPLQEGMLFHSIYAPEDGIYFEQVTGKITGELNISAFATAWETIINRHDILRSAFVWQNQNYPLQIVSNSLNFSIEEKDWRGLSSEEREQKLAEYLASDREQGFQLDRAPLMRFTIFRWDDRTWKWVWSHHHILIDGWSIPVIFQEVLQVYLAKILDRSHSLPPAPVYRNYIKWLASQNKQEAEQFWQEQLAGISEPTKINLNLDRQEIASNLSNYQEEELRISDSEFATLQQAIKNHHLTLNTLARAAWALLLQKYGAGEEVLFGVTVSGRPPTIKNVENMVGLFINTLPMRICLKPEVKVIDWLEEIQQRQVLMQQYEYSKLTDIKQAIDFAPEEPLFESILVFENYPVDRTLQNQVQDLLRVDDIRMYERTNYPLTVAFIPDEGLLLKLNYQTQLISPDTAKTMLQSLQHLLLELARNLDKNLGTIELLSMAEKQTAIARSKGPKVSWGDFRAAHQIFEANADLNPDATAIVFEEESISYRELEKRANLLASKLRSRGISYESVVGLYLNPSINFIVALLGVLKAGAAFLPLDPTYPPQRLKWILEDSQAALIISDRNTDNSIELDRIDLDEIDWTEPVNRLNLAIIPSHQAYIIYTSGSTGKPKGVMVTHTGVQNLARSQIQAFAVNSTSRVYQFASIGFDAAISEIFMALGAGASLYIKNTTNRSPGPKLWQALTSWKITHITLPPSLLAVIKPEELPELKTTIVAGESASGKLLQNWSKENNCRLFNAYGPTEATVCASLVDCSDLVGEPTIGKAISNVEMYLLDSNLEPVATGVPGQIYISGISLARGYWNRSDLTAASFIPHPFSSNPGERLYCTGDLGVCDRFGKIRFLGRQDDRVKLRGYRIELGEIEAALLSYEKVYSTVVLLREDLPGKPQLVAYILPKEETNTSELLAYLSEILPSYMLPSAIVTVDRWPLTPNGKIDKKALKPPQIITVLRTTEFSSETEQILTRIWAEVLATEAVHPEDNFFEIGGDSIISLQIVSRAREAGLDIDPKDIFAAKTPRRLADLARSLDRKQVISEPVTGKIPLAPIQRWFFDRNLPYPECWNQTLALEIKESLDLNALEAALEETIAHHDIFRVQFDHDGDLWQQSYTSRAAKPALRVEDFDLCQFDRQEKLLEEIISEEQTFFSFDRPPLLRLFYAKNLQKYGNVLYLFAHHLIVDGVSWRIFLEDLNRAYESILLSQTVALPAPTSSYRQWTTSLENLANSPEIEADLSFWQEQNCEDTLPVDREYPGKNTVDSLAIASVTMSSDRTQFLLTEATANYRASLQEILLAALLATVNDWNGGDLALVDLEGHGREDLGTQLDLSRTVGWFTSLYPVLFKTSKNANKEQLLKDVKERMRAIPHYGQSYGMLRYLSSNAIVREKLKDNKAQISFNYLGQTDLFQNNSKFFRLSNAPTGVGMFAEQELPHLLAVNALIKNESLEVNWSYSQNIYRAETIESLAKNYLDRLQDYLEKPESNSDVYSISDFSLVDIDESELSSILENLEN